MYMLSLDTAAKTAAVCVSKFDKETKICVPLASAVVNSTLTHSESLLPMIDFCLKNASLTFENVDTVAVSEGPGSFTGVRIGISTVKGLLFGKTEIDCVGVSTLEALAYNLDMLSAGSILLPVMDARRNQFYNAFFKTCRGKTPIKRLSEDALLTFDEILRYAEETFAGKTVTLVGDGAEAFYTLYTKRAEDHFSVKFKLCGYGEMYENAYSVAKCAVFSMNGAKNATSTDINPVYLRASQAERERSEKMTVKERNA